MYRVTRLCLGPVVRDRRTCATARGFEASQLKTVRKQVARLGAIAILILAFATQAWAAGSMALMNRVNRTLRANKRLNGATCYVTAPGVVVLHGQVFDPKDRDLAEVTARNIRGVKQVINGLTTTTGEWIEQQARINDTLQLNGFQDVSARVVGSTAYLSGTVTGESEKQRAARVVTSISNLQVVNMIWANPGSVF
jgi:BON domain-containing protein